MSQTDLETTVAHALDRARRDRQPIAPLVSTYDCFDVPLAYRVQQIGIDLRLAEGATRVGHKIGLTSQAMQQQLGVDQPDYGALLDTMVVPSGSSIECDSLIAPRVEAEIAVRLDSPLSGADVTREQVQSAIGYAVPALEIIDSRIADWKIGLADTIADNASSALAVIGEPSPDVSDLTGESVTLFVDDEEVASGDGSALLGDPLESLRWLVQALAGFGGGIDAGDLVLLGAVHASVPLERGRSYRARYRRWPGVGCTVV
jgi:2-keto-4-pentenoate hydratase